MQAALQQQPLLQLQPRRCGNSSTQWPSQQLAAAGGRPCRALLHTHPASNISSSMSSSSTRRAQHMVLAHRQPGESRGQQHQQQRLPPLASPLAPAAAPQQQQQQQTHQQRLATVCRAMFGPLLSASEISRVGGLNNADLHLRQHYEEAIVWDADKEGSRVWRRTMFTFPDWKRHRSSFRYVHHMQTLLESRIVSGLLRPVLVIVACAVAVGAYHTLHAAALVPWLPRLPIMPIEPFQLTSFALSLLLVFRTNSSYSRWWEGRRRFGRITTTCRDMCRLTLALVPHTDRACRALIARWLIAFCRASKWYIREEEPLAQELTPWLQPKELQQLVSSPHPPNFSMLVLSHAVATCNGLSDIAVVKLQDSLSSLSESLSACDRILNTPIPLSYTRHTARFLILWLCLLPLALWGSCGWAMVPTVMVISFVLLGIEEIGVQIEEPFSILALENLCKKAERHISGMMLMDDTTYSLVQQQADSHAKTIPAPWRQAMSAVGMRGTNGLSTHSMDGSGGGSGSQVTADVD